MNDYQKGYEAASDAATKEIAKIRNEMRISKVIQENNDTQRVLPIVRVTWESGGAVVIVSSA